MRAVYANQNPLNFSNVSRFRRRVLFSIQKKHVHANAKFTMVYKNHTRCMSLLILCIAFEAMISLFRPVFFLNSKHVIGTSIEWSGNDKKKKKKNAVIIKFLTRLTFRVYLCYYYVTIITTEMCFISNVRQ